MLYLHNVKSEVHFAANSANANTVGSDLNATTSSLEKEGGKSNMDDGIVWIPKLVLGSKIGPLGAKWKIAVVRCYLAVELKLD